MRIQMFVALVVAFALPWLPTHAQEKLYEERIGWRLLLDEDVIELHTISDSARNLNCLFLCNRDSIRGFVLGDRQAVIQRFYFGRAKDETFLGGFIKDGKVHVFLGLADPKPGLHVRTLDIASGASEDAPVSLDLEHERLVQAISCGSHFLYFTVNKKASVFAIYDFRGNELYDSLHYHYQDPIWMALTNWNGAAARILNVAVMDADAQTTPGLAHVPNKLYWMRDTLFLVMNSYQKGVTDIYTFSMRTKQVSFRGIVHNNARIWNPPLELYTDNSMLLDGKLYFVSAQDTLLNVQVRDFYTGAHLASWSVHKDDKIAFKNTPIILRGSFGDSNVKVVKQTSRLIWDMVSGSALIMADREDSGRVGLTVGAWQRLPESGPVLPAMPLSALLPWMVVSAGASAFFDYTSASFLSMRFKMLVDAATDRQVEGRVETDIGDRIGKLTRGVRIPPEAENLFRNGGRMVLAYYDLKGRKLVVVGF